MHLRGLTIHTNDLEQDDDCLVLNLFMRNTLQTCYIFSVLLITKKNKYNYKNPSLSHYLRIKFFIDSCLNSLLKISCLTSRCLYSLYTSCISF